MKQMVKPEKGWQKSGLFCFFILYLLLGILFAIQRNALGQKVKVAEASGKKVIQKHRQDAEEQDTYKEIKKVALTFDDGPHPIYTEQILDGLQKRGVKASFFIVGAYAEQYPEIVRRIAEEGHTIGNHTYSHMQLTARNKEAFADELRETSGVIEEITGKETIFVRPPYGVWDKKLEKELKMFPVLWTIDPLDWCSTDADCVVGRVIEKIKGNDIILLHDEYESTKIATLEIVDRLQKRGYEFVTVDEILFN